MTVKIANWLRSEPVGFSARQPADDLPPLFGPRPAGEDGPARERLFSPAFKAQRGQFDTTVAPRTPPMTRAAKLSARARLLQLLKA